MPVRIQMTSSQATQCQQALSRLVKAAADPTLTPVAEKKQIPSPKMSNADLVALHVRVIPQEIC